MQVLLTNDDGIEAEGLQAMRRALLAGAGIELAVIAPDGNRSAFARMITTRRPLWVQEVPFEDGTSGFATDGTPVDCVRLAKLGLVEGFDAGHRRRGHQPRLQPGRRHHLLGHRRRRARGARARHPGHRRLPAVQRARDGLPPRQPLRLRARRGLRRARRRASSHEVPLPAGTLLNINVPAGEPARRAGHAPGQAHLPRRAQARRRGRGRRPALLDLRRRPRLPRRAGDRPRRRARRPHRRHARCTSTSPTSPASTP